MSIRRDKKSPIQPSWFISYTDENGIRRRKRVHKNKTEAIRTYYKLLDEINKIKSGESNRPILLKDLIWKYLKDSENNGHSFLTIKRVKNATNAFTRIIGEEIWISDISIHTVERFKRERLREDTPRKTRIAPISVNTELKHLKAMFNWANKMGYLNKSPFLGVRLIKVKPKPIRFLSTGEIRALFNTINEANDNYAEDLFVFYLQTGARRSELLPPKFTWTNIDIERKSIVLVGKKGKRRTIPLNSGLINILVSHRHDEYPFIFSPSQVSRLVKFYLKKAKISDASVHTLRKTCGALLIQAGVDIFRVSKWLGHSTVLVTEQHYVDILPSAYKDISETLGEIGNNFTNKLENKAWIK